MTWEEQARCRDIDPDVFFDPRVAFQRRAKGICGRCPVPDECLAVAMASRLPFGIWGGLNEKERRELALRYRHVRSRADWLLLIRSKALAPSAVAAATTAAVG